jgi:hypothetical protein
MRENGAFSSAKSLKRSLDGWGQFWMLGPFPEATNFEAKMVQNSTPVKNWVFEQKTGERKLTIMLQKPGN